MTFDILQIASIITPVICLLAGVILFVRAKYALQSDIKEVSQAKNSIPDQIKGSLKEIRDEVDRFNLKNAELEEFVTRTMNRVSARSSRSDKNLEKYEALKELMEQSGELQQSEQTDMFQPANGQQRLRRKK